MKHWVNTHHQKLIKLSLQYDFVIASDENITVLPGSFLSREVDGVNPGKNHVRLALVAPVPECTEAAHRIKNFINSL